MYYKLLDLYNQNQVYLKGGNLSLKSLVKVYQLLEYNKEKYEEQKENFIKTTLQDIYKLLVREYNPKNLSFEDCDKGLCCINNELKEISSPIHKTIEECENEKIQNPIVNTFYPVNKWIGPISSVPYKFNAGYHQKSGLTIIPSILSRLGDIIIPESHSKLIIKNIIDSHIQLLYYLEDTHELILPSAYDSFMIDSKIHYMDLLLLYGLCDPDTIVLYYDLENDREDISLRSEKTQQNIEKLIDEGNKGLYEDFYIKTAFGGSNQCVISVDELGQSSDIYMNLLSKFSLRTEQCIGKYYGLIIQPKNPYFNPESGPSLDIKKRLYGELRCFCFKGDIKAIIMSSSRLGISEYEQAESPFWLIHLHKSVLIKKKEIYLENLDSQSLNQELSSLGVTLADFKKMLDSSSNSVFESIPTYISKNDLKNFFHSEGGYIEMRPLGLLFRDSNIIDLCKTTYNVIKKNLEIDGVHHRIDIINSHDNYNKYIVNEVENINFGGLANKIEKSMPQLFHRFAWLNDLHEEPNKKASGAPPRAKAAMARTPAADKRAELEAAKAELARLKAMKTSEVRLKAMKVIGHPENKSLEKLIFQHLKKIFNMNELDARKILLFFE